MQQVKLDIFKEKAKEIAEQIGIKVETCEEFREHKIQGYVIEKHYLVNNDKTIIVNTKDLTS
jgi:hypothetical protein